ncbi:hypothetical protein BDZ45DRAFT_750948 [Acephala macrosclerotiorum]|nr:hypothetical protein BDZ45DRAFT_750948 [Acephala macrosclerotiorum]
MSISHSSLDKKLAWGFHVFIILLGLFLTVVGTYSAIQGIVDAYAARTIGSAFSCADNSNSS